MKLRSLLRVSALAAILCLASLSTGHAASDFGTCWTYCYDQNGNFVTYYQTYTDLDGCCANQDSLCGASGSYHSHWSSQCFVGWQGDC